MAAVVRLIADPERAPLERAAVADLRRALGGRECRPSEAHACELLVERGGRRETRARIGAAAPGPRLDLAVVAAAGRRKHLLVSDMDSTVITVACSDELADFLGVRSKVSAITRRAINGELDFVAALQARVALLEGLPVEIFDQGFRERVRFMPGAATLVRTMRARGDRGALVSGGLVAFAERVRDAIGFGPAQANRQATLNGRLTGRLPGPVRSPASKLALLRQLTRVFRLPSSATLAVDDGATDPPMLHAAGPDVGFRPSPAVATVAPVTIRWGDLTAPLYLQSIEKSRFLPA